MGRNLLLNSTSVMNFDGSDTKARVSLTDNKVTVTNGAEWGDAYRWMTNHYVIPIDEVPESYEFSIDLKVTGNFTNLRVCITLSPENTSTDKVTYARIMIPNDCKKGEWFRAKGQTKYTNNKPKTTYTRSLMTLEWAGADDNSTIEWQKPMVSLDGSTLYQPAPEDGIFCWIPGMDEIESGCVHEAEGVSYESTFYSTTTRWRTKGLRELRARSPFYMSVPDHMQEFVLFFDENKKITHWYGWANNGTKVTPNATDKYVAQCYKRKDSTDVTQSDLLALTNGGGSSMTVIARSQTITLSSDKAGNKNLLKKSNRMVNTASYDMADYDLTENLVHGELITCTIWGDLGSDRTQFYGYNSGPHRSVFGFKKIKDGLYQATGLWQITGSAATPSNKFFRVCQTPLSGTTRSQIRFIKLERGGAGTDWTPAPEDTTSELEQKAADLTEGWTNAMDAKKLEIIKETDQKYALQKDLDDIATRFDGFKADANGIIGTWRTDIGNLKDAVGDASSGLVKDMAEVNKYIQMKGGKIILGQSTSDIKLIIDNDRISFGKIDKDGQTVNEVAYFSNESMRITQAKTDLEIRFGDGAWVAEPDGTVSLKG